MRDTDSSVPPREAAATGSSPALRQAFLGALEASLASRQEVAAEHIAALREELQALSTRLVIVDRQLVMLTRQSRELATVGDLLARADDELSRIVALPRVQHVEVVDTTLHVITVPLHIAWRGRRYDLGAFRIAIGLNGDIRVESIDKRGPKPGWDHPHVQGGRPCLGNVREGVLKLIAEYEFALAVQVMLNFLEVYQAESAYCAIEEWPRLDAD